MRTGHIQFKCVDTRVLAPLDDLVPRVAVVFLHDRSDEHAVRILALHFPKFVDPRVERPVGYQLDVFPAKDFLGLAAPQVGVLKRLFIMDCSSGKNKKQKLALINPVIESEEGEQIGEEGCLSFPGIFVQVARPQRLVVRARDVDGSSFKLDVMDLEARCVSHETDHLDGELFINYLSPLKRDLTRRKIKKRIKQGDW